MKKSYLVDVPVLLIFFNRPSTFCKVFEKVKEAKPSIVLLYQDGPRNASDIDGIKKCREIAEQIDWECTVYKNYQDKNVGCDPSGYNADKWAFSIVSKCIILEDDVVPSVSFFKFSKEMLDKYEFDERIMLISGINYQGITKGIDADYFFTLCTDTWGWATWKRVVDQWDPNYSFLDNSNKKKMVQRYIKENNLSIEWIKKTFINHRNSGVNHFETILISNQIVNNGLTIIPTKNMIHNIGFEGDSTHFYGSLEMLAKRYQKVFTMPIYELDDTIKHPEYILDNRRYIVENYKVKGWNRPLVKIKRTLEVFFRLFFSFHFIKAFKFLWGKIKKIF